MAIPPPGDIMFIEFDYLETLTFGISFQRTQRLKNDLSSVLKLAQITFAFGPYLLHVFIKTGEL